MLTVDAGWVIKYILNFLVYDTVSWMGEYIASRPLDQRLKCVQNDVLWPRKLDKTYDFSREPLKYMPSLSKYVAHDLTLFHSVKLKEFMALKNLPYLFDQVIPNLKHENDGLIFTPIKHAYIPGTCRQMYVVKFLLKLLSRLPLPLIPSCL